jgi:hypothetical protein
MDVLIVALGEPENDLHKKKIENIKKNFLRLHLDRQSGATTLSITTLCLTALRNNNQYNDYQHHNTQHNVTKQHGTQHNGFPHCKSFSLQSTNGTVHIKNENIYSYLETSGGQSYNLYLNVVHFLNASVN